MFDRPADDGAGDGDEESEEEVVAAAAAVLVVVVVIVVVAGKADPEINDDEDPVGLDAGKNTSTHK